LIQAVARTIETTLPSPSASVPPSQTTEKGVATILIVDDDEMERRLLQSALEGLYELRFAANGRIAEEILEKDTIDLVVTDLAMPEVNGLRLIRDLRDKGDDVPIIAISGVAAEQLDLAQDYGARIVLFKPVQRDRFLEAVRVSLARRRRWDNWSPGGERPPPGA